MESGQWIALKCSSWQIQKKNQKRKNRNCPEHANTHSTKKKLRSLHTRWQILYGTLYKCHAHARNRAYNGHIYWPQSSSNTDEQKGQKTSTIFCGPMWAGVFILSVSECLNVWVAGKRQKLTIINSLLKTTQVTKVNKKTRRSS